MPNFFIKTLLLETGERLPLLCSKGGPLFEPVLFALSLRAKSSATNTIQQAMRSVAILKQTTDFYGLFGRPPLSPLFRDVESVRKSE